MALKAIQYLMCRAGTSTVEGEWAQFASKLAWGRIPPDLTISYALWRIFCALNAAKCVYSALNPAEGAYSSPQTP